MKDFRARAKAEANREAAEDVAIATVRRVRRSWSDERIQTLLTSPLYAGFASPKRRYRSGGTLVRDALYWVPLIMLFMGLRPSEILQLCKEDIVRRDGIPAICVVRKYGKRLKRDASERTVPMHRTLLALGFLDWVNARRDEPGRFLFPEIMDAIGHDVSPAGVFGGRFDPVRRELGILDASEDVYALRRTQSTRMANAGVSLADRSALLGHQQADITNLHYTDANLRRLKQAIDSVDYRLKVAHDEALGCPRIVACALVERPAVLVDLRLDDYGDPMSVTLFEGEALGPAAYAAEIAPIRSWAGFALRGASDFAIAAPKVAEELARAVGDRRIEWLDPSSRDAYESFMSLWCD